MGLIAAAIVLLVVACDQGSSTLLVATPTSLAATPTSPPRIEVGPVGSGLFLPVLSLEYRGETITGFMRRSCWAVDYQPGRECEDILRRYGVDLYTEVARGESIIVQIDTETRPKGLFTLVVTEPGEVYVDFQRLSGVNPRFNLDLPPGDYKVMLTGQWEEGNIEVSYEFVLSLPGEPVLRGECAIELQGSNRILVLSSLDDPKRTSVDHADNAAGCSFNKPIVQVRLTLVKDSGPLYIETFHIDPPTPRVGFPLPDGLVSERTGGPLPPGEYSRRMVVIAAGGEERDLTKGSSFDDVVILAKP